VTPVTVSIISTSSGSDGAAITYSLDDGAWTAYAGAFDVMGDGPHHVNYKITDNAGREMQGDTGTFNIDRTPPTIDGSATTEPAANGWYDHDVVVHFTATDSNSGISDVTPDITLSSDGASQSATGTATDNAGHSASYAVGGINIDKTAPVTSYSPAGLLGNNGWYRSSVSVTLSASDATSGVEHTEYSMDNAVWMVYSGPFTVSDEGSTAIYYRSVDQAGNKEPVKSATITIDRTEPTAVCSLSGTTYGTGQFYSDAGVTLSAEDSRSGVQAIQYGFDNASWTAYSGPFSVARGSSRTLYYRAFDQAGNVKYGSTLINFAYEPQESISMLAKYTEAVVTPTIVPSVMPASATIAMPTLTPTPGITSTPTPAPTADENTANYTGIYMALFLLLIAGVVATYYFTQRQK
jgi:hypothetical protein